MKSKPSGKWLLYIVRCRDGTFYTGITNNLDRRLELHNSGAASRYTRSRLPVALLYTEACRSKSGALRKELRIKALTRREKEEYIEAKPIAGKAAKAQRGQKRH
jgi:predicted GIY-YIG superfamily endonuclease